MEKQEKEVKKIAVKSEAEIYSIWCQYQPMWRKWAYKMTYIDYTREDWEQESYIICKRAVETYKEESGIAFSAYYRMLLYREGKRMMNKERTLLIFDEQCQEEVDSSKSIEQTIIEREVHEWLWTLLENLDEEEKYILKAYYVEQLPLKQIAETLGVKYKRIEYKKKKILEKLAGWTRRIG